MDVSNSTSIDEVLSDEIGDILYSFSGPMGIIESNGAEVLAVRDARES